MYAGIKTISYGSLAYRTILKYYRFGLEQKVQQNWNIPYCRFPLFNNTQF